MPIRQLKSNKFVISGKLEEYETREEAEQALNKWKRLIQLSRIARKFRGKLDKRYINLYTK